MIGTFKPIEGSPPMGAIAVGPGKVVHMNRANRRRTMREVNKEFKKEQRRRQRKLERVVVQAARQGKTSQQVGMRESCRAAASTTPR